MAVFFVDFTNGTDGAAGSPAGSAWQTLNNFSGTNRNPGDICWVRNGGTHPAISADITFTSDGSIANPIIIKADDGSQWADGTGLTNTYTLTYGGTLAIASGTESQLLANNQIYFGNEFSSYVQEVLSVSGTEVTMWPPYLGGSTGSSIPGTMLPSKPYIDFVGSAFQMNISGDENWVIQGLWLNNSGDTVGALSIDSSALINYCTFTNSTATSCEGITNSGYALINRCRFFNNLTQITLSKGNLDYCLLDGNNLASSVGLSVAGQNGREIILNNSILKNHATGDIQISSSNDNNLKGRNVKLLSSTPIASYTNDTTNSAVNVTLAFEDFNGTLGNSQVFSFLDQTANVPTLQSHTGTVRSGGADKSIQLTPSTKMSTVWDVSKLKFLEYAYYAGTGGNTYGVYFNLPSANFGTTPTASELYLELEYIAGTTTNVLRKKVVSTGTITANGTWGTISVSGTPVIAGQAYLRGFYAKTKETGTSNIFYVDPIPEVT